jgi:hypothetical protein
VIIDMTYDEAAAIVEEFTVGIVNVDDDWQPSAADTLQAVADRARFEAIRPACAFATIWREDVDKPGFERPSIEMALLVEFLIGESIWTKSPYRDEEVTEAELRAQLRLRGRDEQSSPEGDEFLSDDE